MARGADCQNRHMQPCLECAALLSVANYVLQEGYCMLSKAFKMAFPTQQYKADIARQRMLQMPLACIRVGTPESGTAAWFVVEYVEGVNYISFAHFSEALFGAGTRSQTVGIDRGEIKALLGLAQSDREREIIRYSIFKTSGLSSSAARQTFGFEKMHERSRRVDECIEAAQNIRESIDKLSRTQDKAILIAMGVDCSESETDSESDCEPEGVDVSDDHHPIATASGDIFRKQAQGDPSLLVPNNFPDFHTLMEVLEQGKYNWFVVAEFLEQEIQDSSLPLLSTHLKDFYSHVLSLPLSSQHKDLVKMSYAAFDATLPSSDQTRIAASLNGDIVTDSESDSAEDYVGLTSVASEGVKRIVSKKRKSLARRVRRQKAKALAARNFLSRTISKQTKTVVDKFPDIGKSIESFVSESSIGADAWRRTGVLTFDGNLRVKEKVTYERIRQHLEEKYDHRFSYGTVVQLCIARNKRRRSSSNYRGVAQVTTRRARKGFELRYNPDRHWSGALYRNLNFIEYADGKDITNINRDDASGFRLDTLTTHGKHGTPAVIGQDILTTHTDYVNRYPSLLQTTSYNFTGTKSTEEICAGVVKASKVFPKNPSQHYADLEMLSQATELQSAFLNPSTAGA